MDNPFIAEVCEHYPDPFAVRSTAAFRDDKGKLRRAKVCDCGDCFYCDGPES